MASLVFLASAFVRKLKQNDKFSKTIIYSLIVIFVIYFVSNLLEALGSTSQLSPIISEGLLPLIVTIVAFITYKSDSIKKLFYDIWVT